MDTVQSDEYVVRVRGVRERQAGEQCTATAFRGPVGRGAGISARTPSTSMGARPLNGRVSRNAGQDPILYPHRSPSGTGRVGSTEEPSRGSSYRPSGVGGRFRCPEEGQRSLGAEERRLDALRGREKAARPVVSLCLRSLSARPERKRRLSSTICPLSMGDCRARPGLNLHERETWAGALCTSESIYRDDLPRSSSLV